MQNREHIPDQTKGLLILVPTPLAPDLPLEPTAEALLRQATATPEERKNILLIAEEFKVARARWVRWGLPREALEMFVSCNEQNWRESSKDILENLEGKKAFLMSDGGLPAFCDPGQHLIDLCHQKGFRVTSTPFPNSLMLAVVLSGFPGQRFVFEGFLPHKDSDRRKKELHRVVKEKDLVVLMDTPYRLPRLMEELYETFIKLSSRRQVFLAMDLNSPQEELLRGSIEYILQKVTAFPSTQKKREFVVVLSSQSTRSSQE